MIKYIKDYENTGGTNQYIKMAEELQEANNEFIAGDKAKEIQELCDIIQTVYTRFNQLGMRLEDISQAFTQHYIKETNRGRCVVDIEGQGYKDKVIDELLVKIASLEKFIEDGYRTKQAEGQDAAETRSFLEWQEKERQMYINLTKGIMPMKEDKIRVAKYKI